MNVLEFYQNKRVLVTGSTGLLATNLIRILQDVDCTIIRWSRPGTLFTPIKCVARIEDMVGPLNTPAMWEQALEGVDVVFHFAAQTSYISNDNPYSDLQINVLPMQHMLDICRHRRWEPIVLFAGTATQAGIPARLPVDESHPDTPITIYDLHKLLAENYLKYYARLKYVRGAILRLANVYGPGFQPNGNNRSMLNTMILRALNGQPLTIYGVGEYLRDFIYVDDVIHAFLKAGMHAERVNAQHYIVGTGQSYTIAAAIDLVAEQVAHRTSQRVTIQQVAPPKPLLPIETRNFTADSSKIAEAIGWRAVVSLREGINRTIDSLINAA